MILSKCLIKSLLFVIAFEENCLYNVALSSSEPCGKFEQIQIWYASSIKKVDALILRFFKARQTPKELF